MTLSGEERFARLIGEAPLREPPEPASGLARAIAACRGRAALARKLGIRPQAVWQWSRVPAMRVLDVERITGVPREDLRPDLYPQGSAS